jgi:hypothetical protein
MFFKNATDILFASYKFFSTYFRKRHVPSVLTFVLLPYSSQEVESCALNTGTCIF